MSISRYYLQNDAGERLSLCVDNDFYLTSVSGLGVQFNSTASDLTGGFFRTSKTTHPQQSIVGDLVFKKDTFENYTTVTDFIMSAQALYFVYIPLNKEYMRKVELSYLTKKQRDSAGWSKMPIAFNCLTPWYSPVEFRVELSANTDDSFSFPITWDSSLHFGASNIGDFSAYVPSGGHLPGAISLILNGSAAMPDIILKGEDGVQYGKVSVNRRINAGEKLMLSSAYLDSYIKLVKADGTVIDLIESGDVDITSDPFIRIPVGKACNLLIESDEEMTSTAELTAY